MKSPLRWPGGKGRLAQTILGYFRPHKAYVEACCGGAAIFWAKPRDWSKAEILNDLDGELINFYHMLHKCGRRLAGEVGGMPYSRAWFYKVRDSKPRSAFARAKRFWYVNRVSFSSIGSHPSFGVKASGRTSVVPVRILDQLDALVERLRGVLFESIDLVRLIALYDRPTTLFYIDPPYLGVSDLYACDFADADHARLAKALRRVKGTWVLSYNDSPDVLGLYPRRHHVRVQTKYTLGGKCVTEGPKDATELLLSNRPLVAAATER